MDLFMFHGVGDRFCGLGESCHFADASAHRPCSAQCRSGSGVGVGSLVRRAQSGQRAGETPSEAGLRLILGGSSALWSQEMLLFLGTLFPVYVLPKGGPGTLFLKGVLQGSRDAVWAVCS